LASTALALRAGISVRKLQSVVKRKPEGKTPAMLTITAVIRARVGFDVVLRDALLEVAQNV